jgi:hypothetical protein
MRPCASESLNFGESFFLLFDCDWSMAIELCTATMNSLLDNFEYHLVPFYLHIWLKQLIHP